MWTASLPATAAGGPHTISVTSDRCTIDLDDVLFGDVYICSGQSNMEQRFDEVSDSFHTLQDSNLYHVAALLTCSIIYNVYSHADRRPRT